MNPFSAIDQYITQSFVNDENVEFTRCRRATDIALKAIFGVGIGIMSTIPFAPLSINYANRLSFKGKEYFGYVLVAANSLGFFFITMWANFENVETFTIPKTKIEKQLRSKQLVCLSATAFSAAVILGLFSQIPFSYLLYDQSNKNIAMPIIGLISDSSYPILSLNRSFKKIISIASSSSNAKKISKIVNVIDQRLDQILENLMESDIETSSNLIEEIFNNQGNTLENLKSHLLQSQNSDIKKPLLEKIKKIARVIGCGCGLVCVVSELIFLAVLSYKGSHLITNSVSGSVTISTITTAIQTYLTVVVYGEMGSYFLEKTVEILTCTRKKSLVEKQYPWIVAINIVILIQSAFSFGPSMETAFSYFEGKSFQLYLGITASVGIALLTSHAMMSIFDRFFQMSLTRSKQQRVKKVLDFKFKIEKLKQILSEAPSLEKAKFLYNLDPKIYEALNQGINLDKNALQAFINENSEETPLLATFDA